MSEPAYKKQLGRQKQPAARPAPGPRQNTTVDWRALQQAATSPENAAPQSILQLQRIAGNQAVHQSVSTPASDPTGKDRLPPAIDEQIQKQRGAGQYLDESVRAEVEPRLRTPFSGVRIHTDDAANRLSRAVGAEAFTVGKDIFFRQGQYRPGTLKGRELLRHELTHVAQQHASGAAAVGGLRLGEPSTAHEKEAKHFSAHLSGMDTSRIHAGSLANVVQRGPGDDDKEKADADNGFTDMQVQAHGGGSGFQLAGQISKAAKSFFKLGKPKNPEGKWM
jgi:hypothetical protein